MIAGIAPGSTPRRSARRTETRSPSITCESTWANRSWASTLISWRLSETRAYLRHLEITVEAEMVNGSDPERWRAL